MSEPAVGPCLCDLASCLVRKLQGTEAKTDECGKGGEESLELAGIYIRKTQTWSFLIRQDAKSHRHGPTAGSNTLHSDKK
jgi:hypothetical protein